MFSFFNIWRYIKWKATYTPLSQHFYFKNKSYLNAALTSVSNNLMGEKEGGREERRGRERQRESFNK
jgi:hypothetical protein